MILSLPIARVFGVLISIWLSATAFALPIHDAPQMRAQELYRSITNVFTSVGMPTPGPLIRDRVYVVPSEQWLGNFAKTDTGRKKKYVSDAWDCDDFALTAMERACDPERSPRGSYGITVGTAQITIQGKFMGWPETTTARHMLNVVLLDTGVWYFYEPQTGKYERADESIRSGAVLIEFILI